MESTINQVVSKRFVKKQQKSAEEVRGGQSHSQTRSLVQEIRENRVQYILPHKFPAAFHLSKVWPVRTLMYCCAGQ
ncbi:MAG TPA: hypothetical protein VFR76_09205 [Verrucomicrobiae bacterium]|nr:hypothetical protein [Verrucomicrobiae bacterium]